MDHPRRRHAGVQHRRRPPEGADHPARSARHAHDRRPRPTPSATSSCAAASSSRKARSRTTRSTCWRRSTSPRTRIRGPSRRTSASTAAWSSSASSEWDERPPAPHRRPRRAPALHVHADARRVAPGRGVGRRHALHLGSLLPALRRSRRRALRVLEPARRDRGGHGAHPLRRARDLQLLPQPEPARRHGAHGRPDLRRPPDPRPGLRLVRARLRRVRLRVRHRDHAAERVPRGAARDPRAPRQAQPAARARARSRC